MQGLSLRGATAAVALGVALVGGAPATTGQAAAPTEAVRCDDPPAVLALLESSEPRRPAPDVEFVADGERPVTLAEYRGRGVVLNFWATWCPPCVKEMPALDALNADVADDGIEVLALSSDFGGAEAVRQFYDVNGIRHLAVLNERRQAVSMAFEIPGLPTTVLIDADGDEVARLVGAAEWDDPEVAAFLRRCLSPAR
ncbi:MAG: TlpA family protein disulfide reductase [Rhodospirillales bacterium]|nr:MAG: TlpA family protein disulfide reductase [Rhodospirillales bacterium]